MRGSDRKSGLLALLCVWLPMAAALQGLAQPVPATVPAVLPQEAQDALSARQSRLQSLTPEQRIAFTQRLAAWDALPRAEREDRRARYLAWRELEAGERVRLQGVAAEVAGFSPERQQALRQEFAALDASQRAGWRLGAALGSDYERLHPLIAYVPAGQRLPLLAALRTMQPGQRVELGVLAQRTPPQERQALREELLATPLARRDAWLVRKMGQ
jgi:Protein of unknown function (DUF3106).